MFNDERSLEKSNDQRTFWVFGPDQGKYNKNMINGVSKGNG